MDEKIEAYIKESKGKGFDDAKIKTALLGSGYSEADIDAALAAENAPADTISTDTSETTEAPAETGGFSVGDDDAVEEARSSSSSFLNLKFLIMIGGALVVLAILGYFLFFFGKSPTPPVP